MRPGAYAHASEERYVELRVDAAEHVSPRCWDKSLTLQTPEVHGRYPEPFGRLAYVDSANWFNLERHGLRIALRRETLQMKAVTI